MGVGQGRQITQEFRGEIGRYLLPEAQGPRVIGKTVQTQGELETSAGPRTFLLHHCPVLMGHHVTAAQVCFSFKTYSVNE